MRYIKLSDKYVRFSKRNLTGLIKSQYDNDFLEMVYACPLVTMDELRQGNIKYKDSVRIQYNTKEQFKRIAKMLGLMDDFKVMLWVCFDKL